MSLTAEEMDYLKKAEQQRDFAFQRTFLSVEKYVDFRHSERIQVHEFIKEYGYNTIRSVFVLNGGAVLALLTLVGALFSKAERTQLEIAVSLLHKLAPALLCFAGGLAAATLAASVGYLNFCYYAAALRTPSDLYAWTKGEISEDRPTYAWRIRLTRFTAILLTVGGMGVCAGAWFVYSAFNVLGIN